MNLTDLQTQFQAMLPEYPYSSYTSTVLSWFNEAQKEIAEKKIIADRQTSTSTASMTSIDKPDTCIEIKRNGLYVNNSLIEIKEIGEVIDNYGIDWRSEGVGTPVLAVEDGESLIFVPGIETADLSIELFFWGYPNDLSSGTDIPFTTGNATRGYDYHNHLRSYDPLVLDYALKCGEYSLGMHTTKEQALIAWYSKLDRKVNLNTKEPLQRQTIGIDPFMAKKTKDRNGIA